MNQEKETYKEEDVIAEPVEHLIIERVPWLFVGLIGGLLTSFVVSKYEVILSADVRLAFFIPIIVYLSDAVGTQTETIYVRELSEGKKINFKRYLIKETAVGVSLGALSGIILGLVAVYWLESSAIGLTIGLAMLLNLTIAPALAIFIPRLLYKEHSDPALGAGPVATVMQDLLSLLVYFLIASVIIF